MNSSPETVLFINTECAEAQPPAKDIQPLVAVVILNWNGKKYLEKFLPSVIASTYANKLVVVADNASSDDSVSFLKQCYPGIKIILNNENGGFAKGYNSALKQIDAPYYVLLNSDVEVTPGWIEPIITLMEADRLIGACQPKLLDYQHRKSFEYAGACGGWLDNFGYPFARGRVFETCEEDKGQYDNAAACFWASGAAFFVRSAVYKELRGFDEFFFAHQEEVDLCWRMQLSGYKVYCDPASVVYHVGGGTLPKGNSRKTFLNFRNNLIMLCKNFTIAEILWKIPARLLLDAIAAWKELLAGDTAFFVAVLKAHFAFIAWLLFSRGNSTFTKKKERVFAGWYHGSIVWDYFVKRRTQFAKIVEDK